MSSSSLERFWGHTFYQNVRSIKLTTEWHLWFYYITCCYTYTTAIIIYTCFFVCFFTFILFFHFLKIKLGSEMYHQTYFVFLIFSFEATYKQTHGSVHVLRSWLTCSFGHQLSFFFTSSSLSWELWLFARVSLSLKAFFCLVHQFIALMWN